MLPESALETPGTRSTDSLRRQIDALGPWFHNLRLAGIETAPHHFLGDYPKVKYERFSRAIPADLTDKTVLDIGCNAGFYSMEMKRRGAARVLGLDTDERYLRQARFAANVEGLEIEYRRLSVWDVAALGETFDLVIFMGVLYHLRHPLLALDLIYEHVTRDMFLFQSMLRGSTEVIPLAEDYEFFAPAPFERRGFPRMHFIEHQYAGDPTNWWIPNRACMEAMLRSAGFRIHSQIEPEVYLCFRESFTPITGEPYCVYPARTAGVKG